jgi:REP element-mobilizing transposase RayT
MGAKKSKPPVRNVAQASSPASSGTVSVPGRAASRNPIKETRDESPPELAGETAALHENPLIAGFHFRGVLPHLKKEGGTYFVTFRQAGTLPQDVVLRFKQEREALLRQATAAKRPLTWHEQQELFHWYSSRVDRYLDAGHGICRLREPALADLVAGAIQFFQGEHYELYAWVVMSNHVHVVVWPMPGHTLSDILHSWKSFTAHEINKARRAKVVPFWQSESYEHLIRDDEDLYRCCHYTSMNPVNAKLCLRPELWKWSSACVSEASSPASSSDIPAPE